MMSPDYILFAIAILDACMYMVRKNANAPGVCSSGCRLPGAVKGKCVADDNTICSHSDMKFQAIVFKCRKNEKVLDLNISDELIKPVSLVKLLGVLIDDNLSFNEHISKLCVKAARQTNALRRIVKYIPNECRLDIYQAFISSNFNFCDVVWYFCSNRSTYKIEKVHKNALRVTLNDFMSSYSNMLAVVKRPTLYISRIKNIAIETFKSVKGLNPKYMGYLFSFSTTPYCTRGGYKLVRPKVNMITFGINRCKRYHLFNRL